MAKSYFCGVCRTSSPPSTRWHAERDRHQHRARVHHGRIPDGEEIRTVEADNFDLWEVAKAGLFILALLIADWAWRHL
jgi:hypothetical protein